MILQVRHAMKSQPFTVPHDYSVTDTVRSMISADMDTLIVIKKDEILGSVTLNDILRYTYTDGFNPSKTNVESITNEDILLVRPSTSLKDVRRIFTESNNNTLPVVDSKLVGYITLKNLITIQPETLNPQVTA